MQTATLIISSASLVASLGCLAILAKTAFELSKTKTQVESDIETVKVKVAHNAKVVKAALNALEV